MKIALDRTTGQTVLIAEMERILEGFLELAACTRYMPLIRYMMAFWAVYKESGEAGVEKLVGAVDKVVDELALRHHFENLDTEKMIKQ